MRLIAGSVVVQLIIGALIKAYFPYEKTVANWLTWTTFSVVGLFMMVGLQLHPRKFKGSLSLCLKVVAWTTVVPFLFFYLVSHLFGLDHITSLTVAVVLITTGTGVTIQTLSNLGQLKTELGEFITLVSALDDVPAAIMMGLLMMNAPIKTQHEGTLNLPLLAASVVCLLAAFAILRSNVSSKRFWLSLYFIGFGVTFSAVLERFHISLVMGGLISGLVLSAVFRKYTALADEWLEKILNPILIFYMIFTGMKLAPSVITDHWTIIFSIVMIIVAILAKWGIAYFVMRNQTKFSPVILAWGMVPRGIPGFAFSTAAVAAGLISTDIFTVLVLIVSVTTWVGLLGLEYEFRKKR